MARSIHQQPAGSCNPTHHILSIRPERFSCLLRTMDQLFTCRALTRRQILRPQWTELYHARKKQTNAASRLPELPKSLFGWIPVIYRISHEEVLASAGLDAYAFLTFFRYAIKYLSITLFFILTVILHVNYK